MHIKNLQHPQFKIQEFRVSPRETWCIFGKNRSGIDYFVKLLSGKLKDYTAELLQFPDKIAVLSFQAQQELYEEEIRKDESDFIGTIDPGTLVQEFIPDFEIHLPLLKTFGMDQLLDLGYRQLSSGQSRKLLLLQQLTSGATTLVIQNPYDGLDVKSCRDVHLALQKLSDQHIQVILFVNSETDIPSWCSHLAFIREGALQRAGKKESVLPLISATRQKDSGDDSAVVANFLETVDASVIQKDELVFLHDGFAEYGSRILFSGLNVEIRSGDHTLITGPNGCGKSTLLDIITGDNPKCYANNLRIFGRQRGTGESIWEIKQQMGIVSPSLHREHRVPGSALHIILSGLFDSIGLYKQVHNAEINKALTWLDWVELKEKRDTPFRHLAFAEQRLVLIARALIKLPKLLILDEPTQGLDDGYRNTLLNLLEKIADRKLSTILFVSHRQDEYRTFFKNHIQLGAFSGDTGELCKS